MKFYPAFIRLSGRRAVVIGGGPVAARKAAVLASAGAAVAVISPEISPAIKKLADEGAVAHKQRRYRKGDLKAAFIAVAATDDPAVNLRVAGEAEGLGILVNCVSPPEAGNFIVPSKVSRGDLTLAISTGGASPALARRLRQDLEGFLGSGYGALLDFLEEARSALKEKLPDQASRAKAFEELSGPELTSVFLSSPKADALKAARVKLSRLLAK